MVKKLLTVAAAFATFCFGAAPVSAATIIDNSLNGIDGSCAFATVCGAAQGAQNPYAAQLFTISNPTTLTGASLTTYIENTTQSFDVNWEILSVAASGLPGTMITSGSSALSYQTYLGNQFGLSIMQSSFDIAGTTLNSGSYYFALQAVTSAYDVYLATADGNGAAYTADTSTWTPNYANGSAVAISLSGDSAAAVPELSTWGMMIVGFALAGLSVRCRRAAGMICEAPLLN